MANCKSELVLNHFWVNIKNEQDIIEGLKSLIEQDCDLSENEDYFRDDTLELGYDNEVDRIVKEAIEELGLPTDITSLRAIVDKVTDAISSQEYFGVCEVSVIAVTEELFCIAFATGGNWGI